MSLCLSCSRDQDPYMGQFSDGHYPPVVQSELERVPSWVRDKEVYSVKECSRWEENP